jgi:hypothetical protein
MVVMNLLANILPINGVTTGQVSDSFENLFAPAGVTFSIWGLIYLLLGGYTLYHLGLFRDHQSKSTTSLFNRIGVLFSISSLANASWVLVWHNYMILLSLLLIVVVLVCLIKINELTARESFTGRDYFFIRLPFSIYFGWITIATIANVTILLVSIGWGGFGLAESTWAVIILLVGLIIATATMIKNRDIAYGLVIVWAYAGILLRHISPEGFGGQYPAVITTVVICIVLLLLAEVYLLASKKKLNASSMDD